MTLEDVNEDGATLSRREQISQRILDAAIELITVKGPQSTTVRDITEMTGANVSAVNYYFRSKDELIQQALNAIVAPVNAERRALLAAAQDAAAPDPAPVEAILEALIRPMLTASRTKDGGRHYIRAVQYVRVSPGDPISVNTYAMNNATAQMFIDALAQALPDFTRAELVWRYEFARGAAIHLISNIDPSSPKLSSLLGEEPNINTSDEERVLAEILLLTTAALKQPPAWSQAELK